MFAGTAIVGQVVRQGDPAAPCGATKRGDVAGWRTRRQRYRRGWPCALILIVILAGCGQPLAAARAVPGGALVLIGNGTSADGSFAAIAVPPRRYRDLALERRQLRDEP